MLKEQQKPGSFYGCPRRQFRELAFGKNEELESFPCSQKYICILKACKSLKEGGPKAECYGNRTKTLFHPQSMYSTASALPLVWVHGSQLCLNGKYIFIRRRLLTGQLFLPVLCFVFKGKLHFFLSSPTRLLQVQKDRSTRQGSDLFSTSGQEGAGCHKSCFPLYYTTYNRVTLLCWIILPSQHMLSENLWNIANLASTLFTRCSASVASAISNVDQELKAQRSTSSSAMGQTPRWVSTTTTLPCDGFGHAAAGRSSCPELPLKHRAQVEPAHYTDKTDSVITSDLRISQEKSLWGSTGRWDG